MGTKEFDPQVIAITLMQVVPSVFTNNFSFTFTDKPEFIRKEIIEYKSRMRVFGLEKFDGPCYVSSVSMYLNDQKLKKQKPCGTIVIYIEPDQAKSFLDSFGFKGSETDDDYEETLLDSCGEISNLIVGSFKNEMALLNFPNLVISTPVSRKDNIDEGVEFPYSQYYYHQLTYSNKGQKILVIDCVMEQI